MELPPRIGHPSVGAGAGSGEVQDDLAAQGRGLAEFTDVGLQAVAGIEPHVQAAASSSAPRTGVSEPMARKPSFGTRAPM